MLLLQGTVEHGVGQQTSAGCTSAQEQGLSPQHAGKEMSNAAIRKVAGAEHGGVFTMVTVERCEDNHLTTRNCCALFLLSKGSWSMGADCVVRAQNGT